MKTNEKKIQKNLIDSLFSEVSYYVRNYYWSNFNVKIYSDFIYSYNLKLFRLYNIFGEN